MKHSGLFRVIMAIASVLCLDRLINRLHPGNPAR
jgi:hypothetical protein